MRMKSSNQPYNGENGQTLSLPNYRNSYHHRSCWYGVSLAMMWWWDLNFAVFSPQINNATLVMRKHQINPVWEAPYVGLA